MGLTLPEFRSRIATDLKVTVDTEISTDELNRCVRRAVDDFSRYMPWEQVYEETLSFSVTSESFTTPPDASSTHVVNAVTLNGESTGSTLTVSNYRVYPARRLTVTLTDANYSITDLAITVKGYDEDGYYIEETWNLSDLKVSGTAYQGQKYFSRVLQVIVTKLTGSAAAGDTISVGTGNPYDSYVRLANKPLKPEKETVTNAAGTTTYTRDTDYTMDYINGKIKFINGGDMAADTSYLISYTKSRLGINIASILPVVTRIQSVEYPVDFVPQQFVSFNIFGDFMYVASKRDMQSQEELSNTGSEHIAIYYERKHTPPGESGSGSYPDVYDEVIAIAAAGYALLTEAQEYEQAAGTALTSLGSALTNVIKYLNNNGDADVAGILQDISDDAANLRTAIATALDAGNAYLDEVDTTDLGKATVGAEAYTESGDDKIDAVNIGARVAENYAEYSRARLEIGNARTNAALGYIQEAATRIANLRSYLEQAGSYNQLAQGFLSEAQLRAEAVNGNLVLSDRFRTEGLSRLNEFHNIMRNRVEYRKRTSNVPVRQTL